MILSRARFAEFITSTHQNGARHCKNGIFCPGVDWPEDRHAYFDRDHIFITSASTWAGNVVQGFADQSGLLYKRNRYYDPVAGQFTQQDPIGLAGGLNLYGFAGGDPINLGDPFGLTADTVEVGCRGISDTRVAQHCAVRIRNDEIDEEVFELLKVDGVNSAGLTRPAEVARYGEWALVATPEGLGSEEFDALVKLNLQSEAAARNGERYFARGSRNSNNFVYVGITRSGGRVPFAALRPGFGPAPGLCGGGGIRTGTDCSGRQPNTAEFGIPRIVR